MQHLEKGNKRIAKNAVLLYMRMFVIMCVSFFTSRIVLIALGVSDYGLFNLVGGFIVLFNVLSNALSTGTSRFITYALGVNDEELINKTFSTVVRVHLVLVALFLVLSETIGLWFVNTQLVIDDNRMVAANYVFQAAVLSTAVGIIQIPYNSLVVSHENFNVFAFVEIINTLFKLGIAYVTLYSILDHLCVYSILYSGISVFTLFVYFFYCRRKYKESRSLSQMDRGILPQLLSFSGWGLFNNATFVASQQGLNVFLNWFFGTLINAAAGVAGQVQGILYTFTSNITTAFNPPIIKAFACKDYLRAGRLVSLGVAASAILTLLISIPVVVKLEFLMELWLHKVPVGAVVICQLLLVKNLFNSFNPLPYTIIMASGKIRMTNILCGIISLLTLGIDYLVLLFTHSYAMAFLVGLIQPISSTIIYLYYCKKYMEAFSVRTFIIRTYLPLSMIALFTFYVCSYLSGVIHSEFLGLFVVIATSTLLITVSSLAFVVDGQARMRMWNFAKRKLGISGVTYTS